MGVTCEFNGLVTKHKKIIVKKANMHKFLLLANTALSLNIEPFRFEIGLENFELDPSSREIISRNSRQVTDTGSGTGTTDTQLESFTLTIPQYTCVGGVPPTISDVQN